MTALSPIIGQDLREIFRSFDWTNFKDKTILITGANGHIASYLVYSLAYANTHGNLGAKLIVNSRNGRKLHDSFAHLYNKDWFCPVVSDVCELNTEASAIDYVFHFAGNASPYFISHDPVGILSTNILGTFRVCELSKKYTGCKVIFASTREVYGENTEVQTLDVSSFGRLDPLDPRSCYPESKRAAEAVIEAYHRQYDVKYGILRIAHCYGPGMKLNNDGRVMSDFLNFACNKEDIILNSSGKALRSFIYITDAIKAILLVASQPENTVVNLSNETEELSVLNLARLIADLAGDIHVTTKIAQDSALYTNYKRIPLDCTQLERLGWKPEVNLRTGLERTLSYFSKHN